MRCRSAPFGPRPASVSVSVFWNAVVLIWSVPLAKRKIPYCSSAEKFVSSVATPQNCGAFDSVLLMSRMKRPAVAPTVPSLMIFSWPENVEREDLALDVDLERDLRLHLHQRLAEEAARASRMIPPESSMKNDCACVMSLNDCVEAAPALPSVSCQLPAMNETVTVPVSKLPLEEVTERRRVELDDAPARDEVLARRAPLSVNSASPSRIVAASIAASFVG